MRVIGPILSVLVLAVAPGRVRSEDSGPLSLETIEGLSAYRDRLLPGLLLVTAVQRPDPFLDPSFLPRRHGMAVRVLWEGRVVVLTSATLVADAGDIEVSTALKPDEAARADAQPWPGGLAVVRCWPIEQDERHHPSCEDGPAVIPAPRGACDPGSVLHVLVPANAGRFAVASTVVAARGGVLPEGLAIIQGRFPLGAALFDREGRLAAVVVRPAADSSPRMLVAPLAPPSPPEPAAPGAGFEGPSP